MSGHRDMVDSMLKVNFPPEKLKIGNPYINYFVSAGRDRQILLWKLYDGKAMYRVKQSVLPSIPISNPSEDDDEDDDDEPSERPTPNSSWQKMNGQMRHYFFSIQTTHKDFIRSMI